MSKLLFSIVVFCGFFAATSLAQTKSKPQYHSQKLSLQSGSNIVRLDLNGGTLKIEVRDRKIVSLAKTDASGAWKPLSKKRGTPTAGAGFPCSFDPDLCMIDYYCDDDYCYEVCGECAPDPSPDPLPDPGPPVDLSEFYLAWCTSDCPGNPDNW